MATDVSCPSVIVEVNQTDPPRVQAKVTVLRTGRAICAARPTRTGSPIREPADLARHPYNEVASARQQLGLSSGATSAVPCGRAGSVAGAEPARPVEAGGRGRWHKPHDKDNGGGGD
jgi:hypothetical protein